MFKASSTCDLIALARRVEMDMTPDLAKFLVDSGLMNIYEEKLFTEARAIMNLTHGEFIALTMTVSTDFANEFTAGVFDHILYGKDTEDTDSVGGFSQREIDLIAEYINAAA